MKTDIMTIAVLVFCIGVLASSVNAFDLFNTGSEEPVAALQQGIPNR